MEANTPNRVKLTTANTLIPLLPKCNSANATEFTITAIHME